jgi:hypothetical protein
MCIFLLGWCISSSISVLFALYAYIWFDNLVIKSLGFSFFVGINFFHGKRDPFAGDIFCVDNDFREILTLDNFLWWSGVACAKRVGNPLITC